VTHAVRLAPFRGGPSPVTPSLGVDGFAPLVSIAEPLSVGAPPVAPSRIRGLESSHDVRAMRYRSGGTVTCALDTGTRAVFEIEWDGLTASESDALESFMESQASWTALAIDIFPDGPDGDAVSVRLTDRPGKIFRGRGVYAFAPVRAEEMIS